jgi:hypothetical protein
VAVAAVAVAAVAVAAVAVAAVAVAVVAGRSGGKFALVGDGAANDA